MRRTLFLTLAMGVSGCFSDPTENDPGPTSTSPESPTSSESPTTPQLDPTCGKQSVAPTPLPVNLVISFDRSESMKGKWAPAVKALGSFLSDPMSTGFSASLEFFCGEDQCIKKTQLYSAPTVPLLSLPNTMDFAAAIAKQELCFGTPLNPALQGAMNYAATVAKPNTSTAVVLVSDGLPYGCGDLDSVVAIAQQNAAKFPTYVIGLGAALDKLNAIALAGGTQKAIMVDKTAPDAITDDLQAALNHIRLNSMQCNYAIPALPEGMSLGQINISNKANGQIIKYDQSCANGNSWRFDDATKPTRVDLCPAACDALKKDAKNQIEIVFGCNTLIN